MEHLECSIEGTRNHIKQMIHDAWKILNEECFSQGHFSPNLVAASLNFARMVEVMYGYDDNQNLPIFEDYVNLLLFQRM